jgi:hypothetical protein
VEMDSNGEEMKVHKQDSKAFRKEEEAPEVSGDEFKRKEQKTKENVLTKQTGTWKKDQKGHWSKKNKGTMKDLGMGTQMN